MQITTDDLYCEFGRATFRAIMLEREVAELKAQVESLTPQEPQKPISVTEFPIGNQGSSEETA